jgi:PmbA protein
VSTDERTAEELLDIADRVIAHAPAAGEAEVTVTESATALTRYANGGIHQNVGERTLRIRLRLVRDGRCGVAESQVARDDAGAALVEAAETIRTHSPEGDPPHVLSPDGGSDTDSGYRASTATVTPEERADRVALVCAAAAQRAQKAFGTFETGATTIAMVNSAGLRRAARHTVAELIAMCRGEDGSAYAARFDADAAAIDATATAEEVVERCARNQGAAAVEPGTYEVVLAPYAVGEMLEYLGLIGLGALAMLEDRSFMRFGEKLMSDGVTITDDVSLGQLAPLPFDGEGATTRPVTLIRRGVGEAVIHDSVTAKRAGTTTTGHSFPQPNSEGPLPRYLTLAAGDGDNEAMVAGCRRGLLVTRFWYVRPVHPLATVITGMTRDGTFLIENGTVTRPVRDLRFTQSIVDALSDVRGIGRDRLAVRGYFGATLVPWLHLGRFIFSS